MTFDEFYAAYPKHKKGLDARKAWTQRLYERTDTPADHAAEIQDALAWQVHQRDWVKEGGKYVPLPASYLRGARWEDEPDDEDATPQITQKTSRLLEASAAFVKSRG